MQTLIIIFMPYGYWAFDEVRRYVENARIVRRSDIEMELLRFEIVMVFEETIEQALHQSFPDGIPEAEEIEAYFVRFGEILIPLVHRFIALDGPFQGRSRFIGRIVAGLRVQDAYFAEFQGNTAALTTLAETHYALMRDLY